MLNKFITSLALLTATSVSAQNFQIDTDACAGIEHIRDESGVVVPYDAAIHTFVTEDTPVFYAGREQIPEIISNANRSSFIIVINTTPNIVSFFLNPTFYSASTGLVTTNNPVTDLQGVFSTSNSPLAGAGSNMPPNSRGTIHYRRNSGSFVGNTEILWDSSTCFEEPPLQTTVRTEWRRDNIGISTSYYYVNDGNNW